MNEVTKQEFYNHIGPKDVVCSVHGNWPYTVFWKTRRGEVVAKSVPHGEQLGVSTDEEKYFINP